MDSDIRVRDNPIGYKNPPPHTRFQPGKSGNPKGRPKKEDAQDTLAGTIQTKLLETVVIGTGSKRRKITRRRRGIRLLIAAAAEGNVAALKDLARIRDEAGPRTLPMIRRLSYFEGLDTVKGDWSMLSEDFYRKQDERLGTLRRQIKTDDIPLADLIDQELARRITVEDRIGRRRRVSMVEVIATRFANKHAEGNAEAIKFLQKFIPEKKGLRTAVFTEIAKPTGGEAAWLAEQKAKEDKERLELMKELYPNRNWIM